MHSDSGHHWTGFVFFKVINCLSSSSAAILSLQPYVRSIWSMLFHHCECSEEGTRNLVAECLGKLTLIDPPTLLPNLQSYLGSKSALARSTVVTAVKFTISDQVSYFLPFWNSFLIIRPFWQLRSTRAAASDRRIAPLFHRIVSAYATGRRSERPARGARHVQFCGTQQTFAHTRLTQLHSAAVISWDESPGERLLFSPMHRPTTPPLFMQI